MLRSKRDQPTCELQQLLLLVIEVPVEPADLVVLTVGVVVALLRATHLVAAEQHRHALREEQRGQQRALTTHAQVSDARVFRWTFDPAVPGIVVVGAVLVVLAVGLVVLVVVGDQVTQREAVMRGEEVDAAGGSASAQTIQVAAAAESVRQLGDLAWITLPEAADV